MRVATFVVSPFAAPTEDGLCGHWFESFDSLPPFALMSGATMLVDGRLQLTPARANLIGRDMGVFVFDPRWDDHLSMMRISFEFSAYGGTGADGFSFHLAHRSHTAHWITGPDYQPYESLAVSDGLSIQADELDGYLAICLHGMEVARKDGYSGGRDYEVSVDWTPTLLQVDVGSLRLRLSADETVNYLQPSDGYVLTFAARTGARTNIHSVDDLRIERCFRDYAAMRELQDGTCLPDPGTIYEANPNASYQIVRPYCAPSTCSPPTLTTGQRVLDGCEDEGTLGVSTCNLGCVDGYTASDAVQGMCLGELDATTAAYQHQSVTCTPNSCSAPTPSNWVERELNGRRYFFNLVSGGQSFTLPDDGTIANVHNDGGCKEGPFINFSSTCAPRCRDHYGPSETELTCNGVRLTATGITTFTPEPPAPPFSVTLAQSVLVHTTSATCVGRSSESMRPRLHALLHTAVPPPAYVMPEMPPTPPPAPSSTAITVQLSAPCSPSASACDCAMFRRSDDEGRTFDPRVAAEGACDILSQTIASTVAAPTHFRACVDVDDGTVSCVPSGTHCDSFAEELSVGVPIHKTYIPATSSTGSALYLADIVSNSVSQSISKLQLEQAPVLGEQNMRAMRGATAQLSDLPQPFLGSKYALGGAAIRMQSGKILAPLQATLADAPGGCSQQQSSTRPAGAGWLCSSIVLIASVDEGVSWSYHGRLDWDGGADDVSGPTSVALAELHDGRLLGLTSVGSNRTLYRSVSVDGASWSPLTRTSLWSVDPQILILPNGAVVVSSGRPGLSMWVSVDILAEEFQRYNLASTASSADDHVYPAVATGQTSLHLNRCWSSIYWTGLRCSILIIFDRLIDEGKAQIWSKRVEVYVQPPAVAYEFSCVYCYSSCFQVLEECPTCGSGVYPICSWSAVNYITCNMEANCQYDFNVAMALAASEETIPTRALGATPLHVALDGANFAVDGAVFVDGTIRVGAGARVQTTTVYDRPLRVDITARQSDKADSGCMHFNVFPQDDKDRFSGYAFGGGWWSSCLGSGNRIVQGVCDDSTSVAVQPTEVQVRAVSSGEAAGCLTVTASGNGTLIETQCLASLQQLWSRDSDTGMLSSSYAPGECLRAAGGGLVLDSCDGADPRMQFLPRLHAYCTADSAESGRWRCITLREGPSSRVTFSSEPEGCAGGGLGCAVQAFDGRTDQPGLGDGGGGDGIVNINYWHTSADTSLPQWIAYDLGSAMALCSYAIVARNAACCHESDSPRDWQLRGYDPSSPANGGASDEVDGWNVLDVRWGQSSWKAGERRSYLLIPASGQRLYQLYKLHVSAVGDNDRGVLAIAELELHRAVQGGGIDDSNFFCSSDIGRWAAPDPNVPVIESNSTDADESVNLIDFRETHTYSLDLRSDGVIDFLFDDVVVRSWEDDLFTYGTLGIGNQCRESTIEAVTIHQVCEVTVLIHVEGKGYETRWNIDRLDSMSFSPDVRPSYLAVQDGDTNVGDYEETFNLTSGSHQFNAYAIIESDGWGAGFWQITRNAGDQVIVPPTAVVGRGTSENFQVTCGATTFQMEANGGTAPEGSRTACDDCPVGSYAAWDCERQLPLSVSASLCSKCPAGQYATTRGARSCISCPVGKFSTAGARYCAEACPAGFEPDYSAPCLRGCTECGPGHFADGTSPCQVCSPGFYAEMNRPYCASCPAGRYAEEHGATVCDDCAAGFRSELATESVTCLSCDPGMYAYRGQGATCTDCRAGRFAPDPESPSISSCRICPAGRHSSTGAHACPLCDRGWYSLAGKENCTACPTGRYRDEMGGPSLESCALCEPGKVNPNMAQQTCALCDFGMVSRRGFSGWACLAAETLPGPVSKNSYMQPGRIFTQKLGPTNTIVFNVRGSNSVYIALHSSNYPTPVYEIVLTHADDSTNAAATASLRKYTGGVGVVVALNDSVGTLGLLHREYNRTFWLSADDGVVRFGREENVDAETILSWVDEDYDPELFVKAGSPSRNGVFVGLMTAGAYGEQTGGTAEWEVCHPFWCTGCPAGSYSESRGSWSCQGCPKGRAAGLSGTVECELCGPGTYTVDPTAIGDAELTTCQQLVAEQDDECQFLVTTSFRLGVGCEDDLSFAGFQGQTLSSFCPGSCGECLEAAATATDAASLALGPRECTQCPAGRYGINYGAYDPRICVPCASDFVDHDRDATTPCIACQYGKFANQTLSQCVSCPAGTADTDSSPSTQCVQCLPGEYSAPRATRCRLCPTGRTDHDGNSSTSCVDCARGKYSAGGLDPCETCAAGQFDSDQDPSTNCVRCEIGEYSPGGVVLCEPCSAGTADTDLDPSTICTACLPGYYLAPDATICSECEQGTIDGDRDPATDCEASCQPGQFAPVASVACQDCATGRHDQDLSAATPCVTCDVGQCAPAGQTRCQACTASLAGTTTLDGMVPVGVVYDALQDCVLQPAVGIAADAGAVQISTITQTTVRSVVLQGREPQDFASEVDADTNIDATVDTDTDTDTESSASADSQQLQPTPQAKWWREAFSLSAQAAVTVALAGTANSDLAVRAAVMRPSTSVTVEIVDVAADDTHLGDGRRRAEEAATEDEVGVLLSYTISVTQHDVFSNTEDDGLAGLISALESDVSPSRFSARGSFATSLAQGMNVALGLEHIANPAFIAGVAMHPFDTDTVAEGGIDGIVDAATPASVLEKLQLGDPSAVAFRSDVEYTATSLSTERSLSELLSSRNLIAALTTRATAASWPTPQLVAMRVQQQPPEASPSEPGGIGVGALLAISLLIFGCVALTVREIKRRRMRKSHKVYVEEAKAKDDAEREAESDADRAQREELERIEREAEERRAMEKATRIAEEEMKRVLRARDLKAYEARQREERWEQDKLQAARKREAEAAQAKEDQRREKERMLARLDAMAAMKKGSGGGGRSAATTKFFDDLENRIADRAANANPQ